VISVISGKVGFLRSPTWATMTTPSSSSINEDKPTVLSVKICVISVISGQVFGFLRSPTGTTMTTPSSPSNQ
jgi:hypothetical protein